MSYHSRRCRVRSLHLQNRSSLNYLNVVAFTELMTHAKSKPSSELERGGIYLRNDVRDIHTYIHNKNTLYRYIDRGAGRRFVSVGLAQARPN